MLHLHHGNRLEALVAALCELVALPPRDPLEPELVVVPNAGLGRWLALQLAERLGICTNTRFPLPAQFLWWAFRTVLGEVPERGAFEREVLCWRVLERLLDLREGRHWAPLRGYLEGQGERGAVELAGRIAATFEQYLIYRPEWLLGWEAGRDEHWQAGLWRRLAGPPESHWVHVQKSFAAAVAAGGVDWKALPERVALFGTGTLSPAFLDALALLARGMEVHLYALNPSRQYWGDIGTGHGPQGAEPYREVGNPLLARLGRAGRDFFELVQGYDPIDHEHFVEADPATALGRVQADILDLIDRGAPGAEPPFALTESRSLQVHACSGAMREVEVLYDQLLYLFETLPRLEPSEVVVMVPALEDYAPHIEAVFGAAEGRLRVPYHVADRDLLQASRGVQAFLRLLELVQGRLDAPAVMDLVECPDILRRFGLSEADVPLLRRWVRETGIRWGLDAAHRGALGLPAEGEHGWRDGLDRLLLGFAMSGEEGRLYAGILPHECGDCGEVLGRFLSFIEALRELRDGLSGLRPVEAWVVVLRRALHRFVDREGDAEEGLAEVSVALAELRDAVWQAAFLRPVSAAVVLSYLAAVLGARSQASPFLNGTLTFCKLLPRRCLPARVLCLIGLNDGSFPRIALRPGFDLMASERRRGDREPREEDRYLFLEALLAAREVLYLSYCGQDPRDPTELPPAGVVSELLDYLERAFVAPRGGRVRDALVVRHPLQAFSRRYFEGHERLVSYAEGLCEALREAGRRRGAPFQSEELPELGECDRTVALPGFIAFLCHPARHFLKERLGVVLREVEEALEGHEPFELDGDSRRRLRSVLAETAARTATEALPFARASGLLPSGRVGEVVLAMEQRAVGGVLSRVQAVVGEPLLEPLPFNLDCGRWRLTGSLSGVYSSGLIGYRVAKLSVWDRLGLWVRHLILNAIAPSGVEPRSLWVGEDGSLSFGRLEAATSRLEDLLELYGEGRMRPLRILPRSSYEYARAYSRGHDAALARARAVWLGNEDHPGECAEPYHALCYRDLDPLDESFCALALRVFLPLLEAMEEKGA